MTQVIFDAEQRREQAAAAVAHFTAKLSFETDVADVHAALDEGRSHMVVIDTRSAAAWNAGHIPGALHLPTRDIPDRAVDLVPSETSVITYCWGPGCNGASRGALAFAALGYPVREMIGGFEYWVREGFVVDGDSGRRSRRADPLVAPPSIACDC